ncbi:MAG: hypothetical protein AAF400_02940 [Bacteroidota bacterium]
MYTPFEQLSSQARIWIYQSSRPLTLQEQEAALRASKAFVAGWTSHGRSLQGSAVIRYHRFLILALEEKTHQLSCCIMDSAIDFLRELKDTLYIDLLDRTQLVLSQQGNTWMIPIAQAKEQLQQGALSADTYLFDNTITHKSALAEQWLVPVQDSWLVRSLH